MKHKCTETPCPECLAELLEGAASWRDVPLIHITPVDDTQEHIEEGQSCPCGPTVELLPDGSIMISHNSWDGREWSEDGNPSLN
jgi:hypothetical protein